MAQRAIRFSEATDRGIHEATEKRGFSSPTAFIRHAVEEELAGHAEQLVNTEQRLAAGKTTHDRTPVSAPNNHRNAVD
jgi:hypothetical protein